MRTFAIPAAVVLSASLLAAPIASAEDANISTQTCSQYETQVTGGTAYWGVKQSFRQYVLGERAQGQWTTSGEITDNGEDKTSAEFQFVMPVDPDSTEVAFDADGNITSAEINTKESTVLFEGHRGALYTQMISPYFTFDGETVNLGSSYVGYNVPGRPLTLHTEEHRTEEYKLSGKDTFGQANGTVTRDNGTYTLTTTNGLYTPKPGTFYDRETTAQGIEGIDVLFAGAYGANAPIDDARIVLETEQICVDENADDAADAADTAASGQDASLSSQSNLWGKLLGIGALLGVFGALLKAFFHPDWLDALLASIRR